MRWKISLGSLFDISFLEYVEALPSDEPKNLKQSQNNEKLRERGEWFYER